MNLNCFENISVHIDVSNSTPNGFKVPHELKNCKYYFKYC